MDSSGGVLPGVAVTCRNVRTGLTREAATNEVGIFRFADLPIGQYETHQCAPGVPDARERRHHPDHRAVAGPEAHDAARRPGDDGQRDRPNRPSPRRPRPPCRPSMTVRQVQELPLNGRNPLQLVVLTAGASLTAAGTMTGQQDNTGVSVNGLRVTQNNWRLDGSNYNNRFFGSAPIAAEPGHPRGVHGPVGELQRADRGRRRARGTGHPVRQQPVPRLRVRVPPRHVTERERLLQQRGGPPKPPFKLNQFGGTIGGPILEEQDVLLRRLSGHAPAFHPRVRRRSAR